MTRSEGINRTVGTEKLVRWLLRLSEFDFEVVLKAVGNHHVANTLLHSPAIEVDKSLFKDNVPVLKIATTQAKGGKTETNAKFLEKSPQ